MADIRRAQLQQFKVLMLGIIGQLKSHSPLDQWLGFHDGMMREVNGIAVTLGWRPKHFDDSPHFRTKLVPFNISESGSGLTIFGPYGETAHLAIRMIPSDEQNESWGARRTDTGWEYDVAASEKLQAWCEQYRQLMLVQILPLLESWLTKADSELTLLDASETTPALADGSKADPVAWAVKLVNEHPHWSARQLAKEVGCAPSTLTRSAMFKRAQSLAQGKVEPRRGSKDANGTIEAIDDEVDEE